MATSPPAIASSTFDQTWHETDTAFLDPTSLPVAKVPRAWERKQEKKKSRDGKQKKVWRRYTLRSQHATATSTEEEEIEEQTPDARPVKKLRVRLEGMEHPSGKCKGQKRAFRSTQWDRRKSGLPRKRVTTRRFSTGNMTDAKALPEEGQGNVGEPYDEEFSGLDEIDVKGVPETDVAGSNPKNSVTMEATTDNLSGGESSTSDAPSANLLPASSPALEIEELIVTAVATLPEDDAVPASDRDIQLPGPSDEAGPQESEVRPTSTVLEIASGNTVDMACSAESHSDHDSAPEATIEANSLLPEDGAQELESTAIKPSTVVEAGSHQEQASFNEPVHSKKFGAKSTTDVEPAEEFQQDADMSDFTLDLQVFFPETQSDATQQGQQVEDDDSELTEENLQLELQRDMGSMTGEQGGEQPMESALVACEASDTLTEAVSEQKDVTKETQATDESVEKEVVEDETDDITAGLTLALIQPSQPESAEKRLWSPSPGTGGFVGEDLTMTFQVDDDTALLKDFLTRAAASKANKSVVISRRSSLQNRRDSGAIRQALASPRKILEDKDPNSPSKFDAEVTLDLSQTLNLDIGQRPPLSPTSGQADHEGAEDNDQSSRSSRRSSRTRTSRLPQFSSTPQPAQTPKNISLRRADGGEPIVLKRTEPQELALLTRANTRKNKQGAVAVSLRLLKLSTAKALSTSDDAVAASEAKSKKKNVRWDEQLAYFQEGSTQTLESVLSAADLESLATPDELSLPITTPSVKSKPRSSKDKSSTPRLRRIRGPGAANGTPGKGLLAPASLLPTEVQDEKEEAQAQRVPKPSKIKKMKVAPTTTDAAPQASTIDPPLSQLPIAPVGVEPTIQPKDVSSKERRSRLATPRKVKLPQAQPQPTAAQVPVDGKENQQTRNFGLPTPKKGLQAPQIVVPPMVETGLPRRRAGRKL